MEERIEKLEKGVSEVTFVLRTILSIMKGRGIIFDGVNFILNSRLDTFEKMEKKERYGVYFGDTYYPSLKKFDTLEKAREEFEKKKSEYEEDECPLYLVKILDGGW